MNTETLIPPSREGLSPQKACSTQGLQKSRSSFSRSKSTSNFNRSFRVRTRDRETHYFKGSDLLFIYRDRWANKGTIFGWRTLCVADLYEYPPPSTTNRTYISTRIVDYPEATLLLDPYIVGCLLGDGYMATRSKTVSFSSRDEEIISNIRSRLPEDTNIKKRTGSKADWDFFLNPGFTRSKLRKGVTELGMRNLSQDKFIPEQYMTSSTDQRLEVLQGLMDTDGTVGKNGGVSFCSCSERMARQVAELVRGLGGLATVSSKRTAYTYKGEKKAGLPAFNVNIRMRNPGSIFKLTRKKILAGDSNQYSMGLKNRIENIELIDE